MATTDSHTDRITFFFVIIECVFFFFRVFTNAYSLTTHRHIKKGTHTNAHVQEKARKD
jgi:hypothetical protein